MSSRLAGRIFFGWLALIAAQIVAGMIVPIKAPALPGAFAWLLASDFLVVATLGLVAAASAVNGWTLATALSLVPICISGANITEGSVFLGHSAIPWRSLFLSMCLAYLLVLPLWRYVFGSGPATATHASWLPSQPATALWKFVVSDVLYVLLYFAAGTIIFPFVRNFYAAQTVPSAGKIIALQLLVRGPIFIGVCLLLARLVALPRWKGALAVGLAFTMVSGVAPLLMPNPFFPDSVRWVHMAEVACSNFVFGAALKLLWSSKAKNAFPTEAHAA